MIRILAVLAFVLCALPVVAADHARTAPMSVPMPAACATLDHVLATLASDGTLFVILPAEDVQAFLDEIVEPMFGKVDGVTTVIVASLNGAIRYGLEIDGCVTDPILLPGAAALPTRLSGRQEDGSVWA